MSFEDGIIQSCLLCSWSCSRRSNRIVSSIDLDRRRVRLNRIRLLPGLFVFEILVLERLSSDVSPLVSLVLYLCSQAAEIKEGGAGKRVPTRPKPQKTKKGMRIFAPDHPSRWEVGYRLGAALRQALSEHQPAEPTGTHASPRPHIRRAHWHSFWVGKKDQPDARSVTIKWLPPIPVNVQGIDDLTPTVRDVGNSD